MAVGVLELIVGNYHSKQIYLIEDRLMTAEVV